MENARQESGDHIGALDGLRGLAALWVFLSHVQILSGMRQLWVLSWGDLAVDLFMMISGFLMAHHYLGRAAREPWGEPRTWVGFWSRRFFRIAPAYYLLLAVALVAGTWLGHCRADIGAHYPWTLTRASRYTDDSLVNILAHVSFVFGVLPRFAFETPLPDWSIGLEMQFYLSMPLLMVVLGQRFSFARALAVVLATIGLSLACRAYSAGFEMPSFLPMKLPVFVVGMLCAYGVARRDMRGPLILVMLIAAFVLNGHRDHVGVTFGVMALGFALLVGAGHLPGIRPVHRALASVRRVLSSRVGRLGGEFAYSLYLVHLLVLLPVAALLATFDAYLNLPGSLRFLAAGAISLVVSLLLSALIRKWIERPGIAMGKSVVRRLRRGAAIEGEKPAVVTSEFSPR